MIEARKKIKDVRIYYNPEINIKHLVEKDKMVLYLRLRNKFIAGIQTRDIYGGKGLSRFRLLININIAFIKGIFLLIFGFFFRNKDKYFYYENFVFEKVLRQISLLAKNLSYFLS